MTNRIFDMDIKAIKTIDPEAAAILHSATRAAKKILKRRKELDKAGLEDQPLFVLAGENHWKPAQRLHHIVLLEALKQSGESMAVAYEYTSHLNKKSIGKFLIEELDYHPDDVVDDLDYYLNDPVGRGLCDMYTNKESISFQSNFAMHSLSNYLYNSNLKGKGDFVALNSDAESTQKGHLSLRYSFTRACMVECFGRVRKNISDISSQGVWVRNMHMARELSDCADIQQSRLAIQLCGQDHVNGDGRHCRPKKSLRGIFQSLSLPVFSVFLDAGEREMVGIDAKDMINGKNIPPQEAYYNPYYENPKDEKQEYEDFGDANMPEILTHRAEKRFINGQLRNMGLERLIVKRDPILT
jgi:hypothetical protein